MLPAIARLITAHTHRPSSHQRAAVCFCGPSRREPRHHGLDRSRAATAIATRSRTASYLCSRRGSQHLLAVRRPRLPGLHRQRPRAPLGALPGVPRRRVAATAAPATQAQLTATRRGPAPLRRRAAPHGALPSPTHVRPESQSCTQPRVACILLSGGPTYSAGAATLPATTSLALTRRGCFA